MKFDVIVVGAGHAGIEAALAADRLGVRVLLISNNFDRVGYMSCNPSIGGLAKGHIVREVDALGGEMGRAADETCIQFKRLNGRKGPAVRGSRAQCDKDLYSGYMRSLVDRSSIETLEGEVTSLKLKANKCKGVLLKDGTAIVSQTVILTTGTFMKAIMHFGLTQVPGGRVGDTSTIGISDQLIENGFTVRRLKTGTPPRLLRTSINWSKLSSQKGDETFLPFSFRSKNQLVLPQIECHLSHTNERTHEIIRNNLDKSPMFSGVIEGIGPRYCPSIEDKITRFSEKNSHQTFLEPEGLNSESIYLQGISTSLPESIQYEFLRTMEGLEHVEILRAGYAVEYDFIEPTQIFHNLETKNIERLFLAGQINGTSGYEEAAGQGLMAGVNAAYKVLERGEFVLRRDEAYIGVLIDDLVTKGTKEPYRMMTSRAEFRLVLREDNVLDRLGRLAYKAGLIDSTLNQKVVSFLERKERLAAKLDAMYLYPDSKTQIALQSLDTPVLKKPIKIKELLRRTEIEYLDLQQMGWVPPETQEVVNPVEIAIKYEGYISRQMEMIRHIRKLEQKKIPGDFSFGVVSGLSSEEQEKLTAARPQTLGQAQRISGVNPSAIQSILVHLKGKERQWGDFEKGT